MRSSEGFSGGSSGERSAHPELAELFELLDLFEKIEATRAWLIESGPAANPIIRAMKRSRLQNLMRQLGLDPDEPGSIDKLDALRTMISDRLKNPEPNIEIPDIKFFEKRIDEIVANQEKTSNPEVSVYDAGGQVGPVEIALYGNTRWSEVLSRTAENEVSTAQWIRGVATIIADPIAYRAQFSRLGGGHDDHLTVNEDFEIQNGRHRALALRCLGDERVAASGMNQWVPVLVERT